MPSDNSLSKRIRLSKHAEGYREIRGFSSQEVVSAIQTAKWKHAEYGKNRYECSIEVVYDQDWNGKYYGTKRIRPIFEERDLEIVVITVYTYYY